MIPTEKELIDFIKRRDLVNFSAIAKFFDIKNTTVSDLIYALKHKKLVEVKKIGGNKIVRLKNAKK